jgi:ABC-type Na+ efflux pump permease subunit
MLGIPAIVPAAVAAYAVVGERQQGTLEPLLTTPIRREELLLGKALAALVPSVAIADAVVALFLACVGLLAEPAVASALWRAPDVLAQLLFTPLVPAGRSGSASRSPPEPAISGSPSSLASWRVCPRPWWRR